VKERTRHFERTPNILQSTKSGKDVRKAGKEVRRRSKEQAERAISQRGCWDVDLAVLSHSS
jgi:hypothetical protein